MLQLFSINIWRRIMGDKFIKVISITITIEKSKIPYFCLRGLTKFFSSFYTVPVRFRSSALCRGYSGLLELYFFAAVDWVEGPEPRPA